jgi:esterase
MERFSFRRNGLTLSYLDTGGEAPVIIALHAHWMEGLTFSSFAEAVHPEWRVIALDQRGHGYSGQADSYTREDYLGDMEALFHHLGLEQAVLLGNSLGGVNAYEFAARHPERALALVISGDLPPMIGWAGTFAKQEELENQVGGRMPPYLQPSFRQTSGGWRLALSCPALLIRGSDSRVTIAAHLEQMATRRANTQLCTLDGGHIVHHDNPTAFAKAVRVFLRSSI